MSGPFSIFLTPLFAWRTFSVREQQDRQRLAILTVICAAGAAVQIATILSHPIALDGLPAQAYSMMLWINLPMSRIMTVFGPPASALFFRAQGVALGGTLIVAVGLLAFFKPYREQKLFMLIFGGIVVFGGLFKFRAALATQSEATRYFYIASVFVFWFIACLSRPGRFRIFLMLLIAAIGLNLLPSIIDTPRNTVDMQWSPWARNASSGLPVVIPTAPGGFYISIEANQGGPLAKLINLIGHQIEKGAEACKIVSSASAVVANPQSVPDPKGLVMVTGTGCDTAPAIALTDESGKILGFGFGGFQGPGWSAIIHADPSAKLQAFAAVRPL